MLHTQGGKIGGARTDMILISLKNAPSARKKRTAKFLSHIIEAPLQTC